MSLQAMLDQEALDYFPKVKKIMKAVDKKMANQMRQFSLRIINNHHTPIVDLSSKELAHFEDILIFSFEKLDWINYLT